MISNLRMFERHLSYQMSADNALPPAAVLQDVYNLVENWGQLTLY